jgi:hypothetical protein
MELQKFKINKEKIDLQDINTFAKTANKVYISNCIVSKLFDKAIYFSKDTIEDYSIDFWHMASLENKDLKRRNSSDSFYNIKPCNNTNYSNKCANCIEHSYPINIRNTTRDKCVYRMATIEWFSEIIEKTNNNDSNIKVWKTIALSSKREIETNIKIRYQYEKIDYLIILKETENTYYFITAYPVFEYKQKKALDKEYSSKNSEIIK